VTAASNDASERLKRYLRFLEQDPSNVNLLGDAADLCLETNQLDRAHDLIQRGLAASSNAAQFRYRQSCLARARQDWKQAAELSQALLDEGGSDPAIHYNAGIALAMLGRYPEAKAHLLPLAHRSDTFANLPYYLVRTLHHLGELDEASKIAEAHMAAHADDGTMAGMLSTLCMDRDDMAGARRWSDLALQSNPDDVDALLTNGALALGDEDEVRAHGTFERVIAKQPANGRAWLGRAMANMLKFDIKMAHADFDKALVHMPTHIGTWHALAWCQILEDDLVGAKTSFDKALDLNHNFGETHGGLAVIAALQGRWEDSKRLTTVALKLDPRSFAGRFAQSLMLHHGGKTETAQELVRRMLTAQQSPGGGSLMDMLGRVINKQRPT
jgi:tetratricopeptide (TPR) repeat protein